MKKILILTSVLALTACGGGHGGGSVESSVLDTPGMRAAVTLDSTVVDSNNKITSMVSEVLVAADGSKITPSTSRSATAHYNGQQFNSYRLDDVDFKMGGEDSFVRFEVDNDGKIIALAKYDRSDDFTGKPAYNVSEEGRFVRTGDKEFKKELYIYEVDLSGVAGIDSIVSEHFHDDFDFMADSGDLKPDEIKEKFKTKLRREIDKIKASQLNHDNDSVFENAYTKYVAAVDAMSNFDNPEKFYADLVVDGVNHGLRFADLGYAELIVKEHENDSLENAVEHTFTPYVGGYDVLKVRPSDLTDNTTFSGVAIAGIDHKKYGYEGEDDINDGMLVRQDDAKLTINKDSSARLVMDDLVATDNLHVGKHWYNVQIDFAADTTADKGLPTFTISGTTDATGFELPAGVPAGGLVKEFTADNWRAHEQQYVQSGNDNQRYSGNVEAAVYGRDASDTEATARFGFGNEWHSDDNRQHNEVAIYGAFGGTPIK